MLDIIIVRGLVRRLVHTVSMSQSQDTLHSCSSHYMSDTKLAEQRRKFVLIHNIAFSSLKSRGTKKFHMNSSLYVSGTLSIP